MSDTHRIQKKVLVTEPEEPLNGVSGAVARDVNDVSVLAKLVDRRKRRHLLLSLDEGVA